MLTIVYDSSGKAVSDFDLETEMEKILFWRRDNAGFVYSTENILIAVKLAVVTGALSHEEVVFMYNGEAIPVNKYGACPTAPVDFCGVECRLSEKILGAAMQMHKKEREEWRAENRTQSE